MKQRITLFFIAFLLFSACKEKEQKVYGPRPIKVQKVESIKSIEKIYSGIVAPDQLSSLAFKVSGPLVALDVDAGAKVKKGDRIAQIDKQDYLLDLGAKRASYNTAKAQLERSEKLLSKEAISKQEYESTLASFSNAKAAFEHSQNSLAETNLIAPFGGFIQTKHVENYQKIQAGQSIVTLINPNKLTINMTIPEGHLQYLKSEHKFFVEFDNARGTFFKAVVKDYVQSSLDGSGLPVSLYVEDENFSLDKFSVAIGFACNVKLVVYDDRLADVCVLPLSAIGIEEKDNTAYVFVYNASQNNIRKVPVKTQEFVGRDKVMVTGKLSLSDNVVVAGVKRMVDGQKVKLLTE